MYEVIYDKKMQKQVTKLDKHTRRIIKAWIEKNLQGTDNPRQYGKPLKGALSHLWRYRIGDYRLIVEIQDEKLIILAVGIGHRREIYERY